MLTTIWMMEMSSIPPNMWPGWPSYRVALQFLLDISKFLE
uniref:Uncharacterized protein n=1 Tax=Arundo donax TaxID=35708 RepID=A0A0A8XWG3_ARUDO